MIIERSNMKLKPKQAEEIRERYNVPKRPSHSELAKEYGVSECTIRQILKFKTYKP